MMHGNSNIKLILQFLSMYTTNSGIQDINTAGTKTRRCIHPLASSIHFPSSRPIFLIPILTFSFHFLLHFPSDKLPRRFPTKISLHIPCFPTPATCPVHLSLLDLTVINQNYQVTSTAGSITRSVAQRS
jgi:hypothetical protein